MVAKINPTQTGLTMAIMSDEEAKAVGALASLGTTIVAEGANLGRCVGRILGTAPQDVVGIILGDPLGFVRAFLAGWYDKKLTEILRRRQVEHTQPVSPSVAIPLIRAAYDESRPELQELWAGLIAAAMDPARSGRVRLSFIDTLKQFDPLDALVLQALYLLPNDAGMDNRRNDIAKQLRQSQQDVLLSIDNLRRLGCVDVGWQATRFGRALIMACSD